MSPARDSSSGSAIGKFMEEDAHSGQGLGEERTEGARQTAEAGTQASNANRDHVFPISSIMRASGNQPQSPLIFPDSLH